MAEWLGIGLQNRAQQFDSAWYLFIIPSPPVPVTTCSRGGSFFYGLSELSDILEFSEHSEFPEFSECSEHSAFSECSEHSGKIVVHTADFL